MEEHSTEKKLTLVIVDDHALVLEGLRSLLQGNRHLQSVKIMRSAAELLSSLPDERYDVYLVDLDLSGADGLSLVGKIRNRYPDVRIIVNTLREESGVAHRLMELNVDAVIFRTSDPNNILKAIEAIAHGEKYFCPEFRRVEARHRPHIDAPSPRELDVLKAIARGYSTVEISHLLFISENTVETHRKNLMLKFGARNATDLVMRALERGFLKLPLNDME